MSSTSRLLIALTLMSALLLTLSGSPRTASARMAASLSSQPAATAKVKDKDHGFEPCTEKGKDDKRRDQGRGHDDDGCLPAGSSSGISKGDFNGDGVADLAIGVPGEDVNGVVDAGAVHILYGSSANGLSATGSQFFTIESIYGPGVSKPNSFFGTALASGDFNGDTRSDLAISSPGYELFGQSSAGYVDVLYGSANGLAARNPPQFFSQGVNGIQETAEAGDRFGHSLSWGNFNGDAYGDLVVGVPLEDVGSISNAGAVQVIYGTSQGLTSSGNQLWHQDSFGILDASEAEDRFGLTLAGGDFNGDTRSDLAIGIQNEDVGNIDSAGAVSVLYGVAQIGLSSTNDQFWTQNDLLPFSSLGVEGSESGDRFGSALAAGDFNNDGPVDLAIGVPFEDVKSNLFSPDPSIVDGGLVHVIYGTSSGLTTDNQQIWTQDAAGIEDFTETGDRFGSALAAGNFNGASGSDLAIGVPTEDVGSISNAGAVNLIYGFTNVGLHNGNSSPRIYTQEDKFITQNTRDVLDAAEEGDQFGSHLTMWNFGNGSQADLAIGVPLEDISLQQDAGTVHVLYGPGTNEEDFSFVNQQWTQNSAGITDTAEAGDAFGSALY